MLGERTENPLLILCVEKDDVAVLLFLLLLLATLLLVLGLASCTAESLAAQEREGNPSEVALKVCTKCPVALDRKDLDTLPLCKRQVARL